MQPAFDLVVTNTWMGGLSDAELISRLRVDFPMAQAPELLASAPSIEKVEILAAKLPG